MNFSRIVISSALTITTAISAAAPLPEYIGNYIGVMNRKSLNVETGKAVKLAAMVVELKIEANSTITLTHTDTQNSYPCATALVGKKNFTYRYTANQTTFIIKGKFVGKGKKLKAEIVQASPSLLLEGKISVKKM